MSTITLLTLSNIPVKPFSVFVFPAEGWVTPDGSISPDLGAAKVFKSFDDASLAFIHYSVERLIPRNTSANIPVQFFEQSYPTL